MLAEVVPKSVCSEDLIEKEFLQKMKERERVIASLQFKKPDMVPLRYLPSPAGPFEHGKRLKKLWRLHPQDFGPDPSELSFPYPEPSEFDSEGRYHAIKKDIWGVEWEYRIFGIAGHPVKRPLDDLKNLSSFSPPKPPEMKGPHFEKEKRETEKHRSRYFLLSGFIGIFEVMHNIRRFEDVLMDMASDTPEINRIADMITEYYEKQISYFLARGVDAIEFGDDFGMQQGLMISRELWREFFKLRYERLISPIKKAGVYVFFHSCGNVLELLEDLKELGVDAIWPQSSSYNPFELAEKCRSLKLAVDLHFRAPLMVDGKPEEIKQKVKEIADIFRVREGGSWFHIEIDDGFPYENIKALFEAVNDFRG